MLRASVNKMSSSTNAIATPNRRPRAGFCVALESGSGVTETTRRLAVYRASTSSGGSSARARTTSRSRARTLHRAARRSGRPRCVRRSKQAHVCRVRSPRRSCRGTRVAPAGTGRRSAWGGETTSGARAWIGNFSRTRSHSTVRRSARDPPGLNPSAPAARPREPVPERILEAVALRRFGLDRPRERGEGEGELTAPLVGQAQAQGAHAEQRLGRDAAPERVDRRDRARPPRSTPTPGCPRPSPAFDRECLRRADAATVIASFGRFWWINTTPRVFRASRKSFFSEAPCSPPVPRLSAGTRTGPANRSRDAAARRGGTPRVLVVELDGLQCVLEGLAGLAAPQPEVTSDVVLALTLSHRIAGRLTAPCAAGQAGGRQRASAANLCNIEQFLRSSRVSPGAGPSAAGLAAGPERRADRRARARYRGPGSRPARRRSAGVPTP